MFQNMEGPWYKSKTFGFPRKLPRRHTCRCTMFLENPISIIIMAYMYVHVHVHVHVLEDTLDREIK